MLVGAKVADTKALDKIPGSDGALYERCYDAVGFVPYYLRRASHARAKSALGWVFLLRLNEGSPQVPRAIKHVSSITHNGLRFSGARKKCCGSGSEGHFSG